MIYLITFALSSLILFFTERQRKCIKYLGVILAISIPIFLATMRSESVGIDVATYMKPLFMCSMRSENLLDFFINMKNDPSLEYMEYGYGLISYIASKFTRGLWGIFLVNALLCILPVYFGINNLNKYLVVIKKQTWTIPSWAGMFIYYCIFYNNSLNQVRQIICCALLFYAFMSILNKHSLRALIVFLVCLSFHISSLIFIYIVIIYLISKYKFNWLRIALIIALILFSIFSIQIFYGLMYFLNTLGLIPEKYQGEIFDVQYGTIDINISWLFVGILMFIISTIYYKHNSNDILACFMFFISLSFISLFQLSSYFASFGRIQLYFLIYSAVILPLSKQALIGIIKERILISNVINIFVPTIYWFVAIYLFDYTGTIPYSFI